MPPRKLHASLPRGRKSPVLAGVLEAVRKSPEILQKVRDARFATEPASSPPTDSSKIPPGNSTPPSSPPLGCSPLPLFDFPHLTETERRSTIGKVSSKDSWAHFTPLKGETKRDLLGVMEQTVLPLAIRRMGVDFRGACCGDLLAAVSLAAAIALPTDSITPETDGSIMLRDMMDGWTVWVNREKMSVETHHVAFGSSPLAQRSDWHVTLAVGLIEEKREQMREMFEEEKLKELWEGIKTKVVWYRGEWRHIKVVHTSDWKDLCAFHEGVDSAKASRDDARCCPWCTAVTGMTVGSGRSLGEVVHWYHRAPEFQEESKMVAHECYFPLIVEGLASCEDIYDAAHGAARVASTLMTGIWRFLKRMVEEATSEVMKKRALHAVSSWEVALQVARFPVQVSETKGSITLDIASFKEWCLGPQPLNVIQLIGPVLVGEGWRVAMLNPESGVRLDRTVLEAISEGFAALPVLYRGIWMENNNPSRTEGALELFTQWWWARCRLLCCFDAFQIASPPATHYILNHLGEDIQQYGSLTSLICEGYERQNQLLSGMMKSLIPFRDCVNDRFSKLELLLRHKSILQILPSVPPDHIIPEPVVTAHLKRGRPPKRKFP